MLDAPAQTRSPWMRHGTLRGVGVRYSARKRSQRAALFRKTFALTDKTRVLDLGGGTGAHIRMVLAGTPVRPENICIAETGEKTLAQAARAGHQTALIPRDGKLPFEDGAFDVTFCSSVIEHVTVPRTDIWTSDASFAARARIHQRAFADELRRVSRAYWVQTPAREFVIETHSWLPFVGWLPRAAQVAVLRQTKKFWISKHAPDFHLLTKEHMEFLFPEANILAERSLGMTKSWVAVKG